MKSYRKKREREKGVKLSYTLENPDEMYTFQLHIRVFRKSEPTLSRQILSKVIPA